MIDTLLLWIGFIAFVLIMLALGVFHWKAHLVTPHALWLARQPVEGRSCQGDDSAKAARHYFTFSSAMRRFSKTSHARS